MAVRLHRCPFLFVQTDWHGCWQAQRALEEAGVEHEVVKVSVVRPRRHDVIRLTGQRTVPVIELEDGRAIRETGRELAARIRAGKLYEGREQVAGPQPSG